MSQHHRWCLVRACLGSPNPFELGGVGVGPISLYMSHPMLCVPSNVSYLSNNSAPGGQRSHNLSVKSRLLCQLSYRSINYTGPLGIEPRSTGSKPVVIAVIRWANSERAFGWFPITQGATELPFLSTFVIHLSELLTIFYNIRGYSPGWVHSLTSGQPNGSWREKYRVWESNPSSPEWKSGVQTDRRTRRMWASHPLGDFLGNL